jgi:molybdopterin converting factor subunit 1
MNARVRLFAVARQLAGSDSVEVDLPGGATVSDLRNAIQDQFPELAHVIRHVAFAINTEYAQDETRIPDDAEIACIPPVSGG